MTSSVVSNSQIRTFKRCRRKYWLAYVRKLKPRRLGFTGARQLGTRVHGALEAYYDPAGAPELRLDAALSWLETLRDQELAALDQETGGETAKEILKEHDLAVTMILGYDAWLAEEGEDSDLEVLATESAIRTPSPVPGIELIGKLDETVRKRSTGEEGFIDHKTVGDLQSPLRMLNLDEQFRMYALMQRLVAARTGRPPIRFQIYNMLKKSKRTARAAPPFFARYEVYINDAELRAMWDRLYGEITELVRFEEAITAHPEQHQSIAYPTPTNDCRWDCDFLAVCPMFDDNRADPEYLLAMNYEEGDPHSHYGNQLEVPA